jgi:segregation and condensation protein A
MSINIKLEVFEGPFDLLYHLIEKAEVNIYDIPISDITDQYLDYLHLMEELDLEVASEFLVMAASLLEIKSKMLLPKPPKTDDSEYTDPREELVRKLLEYKQYKEASVALKEKMILYEKIFYKGPDPIELFVDDYESLPNMSAQILFDSLKKLLAKHNESSAPGIKRIVKDQVTIEQKILELESLFSKGKHLYFEELFSHHSSKHEIIVTFLAMLELIKRQLITVEQTRNFDRILIKPN